MPYYDYYCDTCGKLELQRKINDPEIVKCPICNNKINRIFTPIRDVWNCDGNFGKSK